MCGKWALRVIVNMNSCGPLFSLALQKGMAGCNFSKKPKDSVATEQLVINLSKTDKAFVSDVKYSSDSYKGTFASSKSISESMTSKLKHSQTPVSAFLGIKIFIRKKLKGWRELE